MADDVTTLHRLLTVKEYAALVRRHEQSIYKAIRRRTLKRQVVRDGRCILILVPVDVINAISQPPAARIVN